MLDERADLASSFAGQADLSLASSQSGDDLAPVKMQPQQIHTDDPMAEGATPITREPLLNATTKDRIVGEVEKDERVLVPVKATSEMQAATGGNFTSSGANYQSSKVDYAQ